ncbi:hypothetical protein PVK06_005432 [Gossypium arboreum]|uniref:Uncharacterized protein n=1 Tax=Gossypium arboreum TaxID=29729 RepID=A0ABR0QUR9_GOSAR|nr:hypothetical protein PVK06_005432 [Gossypium arboreum]
MRYCFVLHTFHISCRDGIIASKAYPREVSYEVILPCTVKADTVVDIRGLSDGERLLQYSKGDAPFGATTVIVITEPVNNFNRYHAGSSLTATVLKHLLCSCVHLDVDLQTKMKG